MLYNALRAEEKDKPKIWQNWWRFIQKDFSIETSWTFEEPVNQYLIPALYRDLLIKWKYSQVRTDSKA